MRFEILKDFQFEQKVPQELIQKYKDSIPEQLLYVWQEYGFGSFMNGYLRVVNPDEYQELIDDFYFNSHISFPIFTTGMGDIIVWEEERYLVLINYRKQDIEGIGATCNHFFYNLLDKEYLKYSFDGLKQYNQAVKKYGVPAYDECFGYVPLLGLGGAEKISNMKKVKLIEHLQVITHLLGPIE